MKKKAREQRRRERRGTYCSHCSSSYHLHHLATKPLALTTCSFTRPRWYPGCSPLGAKVVSGRRGICHWVTCDGSSFQHSSRC